MGHVRFAACGTAVLALALVVVSAAPAFQVPAPDGSRTVRGSDDPAPPPIRIDAVVTDRLGRPVLDLQPSDFELHVDGTVRGLEAVELRAPHRPGPAAAVEAGGPARGARVFAFMLDEFHVSPGPETDRVRQAMRRFIEERLRPDDLAVVLKPLDHVNAIRFIRDRQPLREAVASFDGRKGDFTPRSAFEEQFIGHAPATVAAARVQLVTVALNELAMQLGELDADRAALVLFSEGFARSAPVRRGSRLIDLQGLLRAASRFHFPVYAFNPADSSTPAAVGAADPAPATLEWLAAQTGGASVLDGGALHAGLDRMTAELDAYYALTLPAGTTDGRFHPIDVRVKRAGVTVRTRPGYWAPLSSEVREWLRRTARPASGTPRRALKRSALIQVWTGLVPRPGGGRQMVVRWEPAPRPPASSGRPEAARIELTARAADATIYQGPLGPAGAARFDVPAGRVEVDMRVLGADGALLDSDIRDVTVPDLAQANATIALSPQIIRARTMIEFRAALSDAAALPTSARSFSRSDRLVIRVPAWAPDGAVVRTGVRLLNRVGQPVRTLGGSDSAAGIPQFELPLAWLAPGEYYLEFSGRTSRFEGRERVSIRVTG